MPSTHARSCSIKGLLMRATCSSPMGRRLLIVLTQQLRPARLARPCSHTQRLFLLTTVAPPCSHESVWCRARLGRVLGMKDIIMAFILRARARTYWKNTTLYKSF